MGTANKKIPEIVSATLDATRSCTIQITNKTNYSLIHPQFYMYHGYCSYPPEPTISSQGKGVCTFQKTVNTSCGAVGVLTYDLCQNRVSSGRMALLFSVPYNYMFYDNIYAVGMFGTNYNCDQSLYNIMYYGSNGDFTRGKAKDGEITFNASCVILEAIMSNVGNAIIKLEIH